jgi:hypothetical protein
VGFLGYLSIAKKHKPERSEGTKQPCLLQAGDLLSCWSKQPAQHTHISTRLLPLLMIMRHTYLRSCRPALESASKLQAWREGFEAALGWIKQLTQLEVWLAHVGHIMQVRKPTCCRVRRLLLQWLCSSLGLGTGWAHVLAGACQWT